MFWLSFELSCTELLYQMSEGTTRPISRKSEQICNRSVTTCCQQADIRMYSLALHLSVLAGPHQFVNRSVTSCCDRAAAMLFSTDLSQVVETEQRQCCRQQFAAGLLRTEMRQVC